MTPAKATAEVSSARKAIGHRRSGTAGMRGFMKYSVLERAGVAAPEAMRRHGGGLSAAVGTMKGGDPDSCH